MDCRDETTWMRSCEIWERQGRTGNPHDHWFEAERELRAKEEPAAQEYAEATGHAISSGHYQTGSGSKARACAGRLLPALGTCSKPRPLA
jgi:hypothetical protein